MSTLHYKKLEERIPSLVEIRKTMNRDLGQCIDNDKNLIKDFDHADLLMDEAISDNKEGDIIVAVEVLWLYLSKLISLDERHLELGLREAMREYLPRLKAFSERNNKIEHLYKMYEKEFRGKN